MIYLSKLLKIIWFIVFIYLILSLVISVNKDEERHMKNILIGKNWFNDCKTIINLKETKQFTTQNSRLVDSIREDYLKFIVNTNLVKKRYWIADSLKNVKIYICSDSISLLKDETIKAFYTNIYYIDSSQRGNIPKNIIIVKLSNFNDGETLVHELSHYLDNLLAGNVNKYWSSTYISKYMDNYLLNYEYDEQYALQKLLYIGVKPEKSFLYLETYKKDAEYYTDATEFFARTMVLLKKYQYCPDELLFETLTSNINQETDLIDLLFWCDLAKLAKLRNII